ncbi:hypothetical protein BJY00DRAFT_296062 [Aspergillus carlsbadensis]|nr:hypothetical protein BJY00DRAFT_296062 [Aspergillus carlsbadensis]
MLHWLRSSLSSPSLVIILVSATSSIGVSRYDCAYTRMPHKCTLSQHPIQGEGDYYLHTHYRGGTRKQHDIQKQTTR